MDNSGKPWNIVFGASGNSTMSAYNMETPIALEKSFIIAQGITALGAACGLVAAREDVARRLDAVGAKGPLEALVAAARVGEREVERGGAAGAGAVDRAALGSGCAGRRPPVAGPHAEGGRAQARDARAVKPVGAGRAVARVVAKVGVESGDADAVVY